MFWNMSGFTSQQIDIKQIDPIPINEFTTNKDSLGQPIRSLSEAHRKGPIENLSEAIKYKTISYQDSAYLEPIHFLTFYKFLERTYPLVFSTLDKTTFSNYSILLKWNGDSNSPHNPILLMAHMDVVPVEDPNNWIHDPFSGTIDDSYVWGRGAIDDKSSLIAILESVEYLLADNFTPNRDIYIAFGHDEENSGKHGNASIADSLSKEGVYFDMILDEGSIISSGIIQGIEKPIAMIGIAEKGYVSLELVCSHVSGHSSMPNNETTIGKLSKAIVNLERNKMNSKLTKSVRHFFDFLGPELSIQNKFLLSNSSFFSSSILSRLDQDPITSAMIRTTVAPTIVSGGVKSNILPSTATAIINFRIRQGDSIFKVKEHAISVINDPDITVNIIKNDLHAEPSEVSSIDSPEFNIMHKTIKEIFGDVVVSPGLVLATTDSRHYEKISKDIYRFMPIQLESKDLSMIHGTNERISKESLLNMVQFYIQLIKNIHAS
jgi:carboxypeptidase PM20D1